MFDSKVFHKSIKGASHFTTGKPCQDFSDAYQDDGMQIAIVCDGHGGQTYFRSDLGAQMATEITKKMLIEFARCVPPSTFIGTSFSITARPQKNPFIDPDGNKVRFEELSEEQKKYARQAQSFVESEGLYPQQQSFVRDLLSVIYKEWLFRIEMDYKQNPLSKKEQEALHGHGIEKAYGCTLLAFLRTKDYWLSFHIGDGKIMCCDQSLNWSNPVPEDCACFLNYTTSLCDSNPLVEFRYSFNGKDDCPLAFMLCSDGLDGSLRTNENLQDFYEQIISLCMDGDDVESELESYLPTLSESGNKDDISLSGIVSFSGIDKELIRKRLEISKRNRSIRNNYRSKKNEIEAICSRIDVLKIKYERAKNNRFNKQVELDEIRQKMRDKEKEVQELDQSVYVLKNEIDNLESDLLKKKSDFDNWKFTVKNEMAELESAQCESSAEENNKIDYTNW